MRSTKIAARLLTVGGLAVLSFACNNTADGMRKDAEEARQEAREETAEAREAAREAATEAREEAAEAREDAAESVDRAGNAVQRAGERTADAARDAARETGQAARNAANAAGAAIETMDVKTALMADSRVDASNINVDTNHTSKTVTLKGHVPTSAQKATAEQIAAKQATGYRVVNQLVVRG